MMAEEVGEVKATGPSLVPPGSHHRMIQAKCPIARQPGSIEHATSDLVDRNLDNARIPPGRAQREYQVLAFGSDQMDPGRTGLSKYLVAHLLNLAGRLARIPLPNKLEHVLVLESGIAIVATASYPETLDEQTARVSNGPRRKFKTFGYVERTPASCHLSSCVPAICAT